MGEIQVYIEKIKEHWNKNQDFYKKNQDIIIIFIVMITGFFISKMWKIKHLLAMVTCPSLLGMQK